MLGGLNHALTRYAALLDFKTVGVYVRYHIFFKSIIFLTALIAYLTLDEVFTYFLSNFIKASFGINAIDALLIFYFYICFHGLFGCIIEATAEYRLGAKLLLLSLFVQAIILLLVKESEFNLQLVLIIFQIPTLFIIIITTWNAQSVENAVERRHYIIYGLTCTVNAIVGTIKDPKVLLGLFAIQLSGNDSKNMINSMIIAQLLVKSLPGVVFKAIYLREFLRENNLIESILKNTHAYMCLLTVILSLLITTVPLFESYYVLLIAITFCINNLSIRSVMVLAKTEKHILRLIPSLSASVTLVLSFYYLAYILNYETLLCVLLSLYVAAIINTFLYFLLSTTVQDNFYLLTILGTVSFSILCILYYLLDYSKFNIHISIIFYLLLLFVFTIFWFHVVFQIKGLMKNK
jgi:hypothetical protein